MCQEKGTKIAFLSDRTGNIGLAAALVLPLVIFSLGLGIDYGHLTLQKRELQGIADLTAVVAASDITNSLPAARNHFKRNGFNFLIATQNGLMDPDGHIVPQSVDAAKRGIVTITQGVYVADPAIAAGKRFVANATPADALQVAIERTGTMEIASMFAEPPVIGAVGTAGAVKLAAFSIGSRLASLNDGIINALLGKMLGTTLSLKVMDYRALIDADLEVQPFLKVLATNLHLTTATYQDVLTADITLPQLFSALRLTPNLSGTASAALKTLDNAVSKNKATLKLAQLINLDPKNNLRIDAGQNFGMKISIFDLISASAGIANGKNQIALDVNAGLPGLAGIKVNLAIGEPPIKTPPHRLGAPGTAVRTAQTRLTVSVSVDGLALLLGLKINLPIYVEVAHAEGKLAEIRCYGGSPSNASVSVDTVPGVVELAIGTVDPTALTSFGTSPRVTPARILDSLLVKIDATAHTEAKNLTPQRLTFTPAEVAANAVKSVSTKDLLTSATQSLLKELKATITLPLLTLTTDSIVTAALAQTLGAVTPAIDTLLYNLLLLVGVKIGEADIRVTGAQCHQPVLVQ